MSQEELNALSKVDESSPDENQSKLDFQKEVKALVDVNEMKDDQHKYKLLLIVNESTDADITLYIYSAYDPLCLASTTSKIILPKQKYLHRDETTFKFELVAMFNEKEEENDKEKKKDKRKKKKLLGVQKWNEDKLIRIAESLECKQENLVDVPDEKRVCLRKIHREKELATAAGVLNLYEILGLDMEEIRKMEKSAAKKAIKKAYHNQIKIWHPDKNFGDGEIALQIITAKEILLDDTRRASYHNGVDYDKGWLSSKRWKAIFWPECCTEEQNTAFWRRIGLSVASLGLAAGGVILTVCTAGTAIPVVALSGAIFGAGCTVGGGQSLKYAIGKDSVVEGCEAKKWALEVGKGFTVGGITGGVTAVYIAATAAAGAAANVGEEAAAAGCVALRTGVKRIANDVVQAIPGQLIGAGKNAIIETAMDFAQERRDDSVENQHPLQHVKRGITNVVTNVALGTALQTVDAAKKIWKGETLEDCSKLSNEEKAKRRSRNTQNVIESGTEKLAGKATEFVEDRFGDSAQNQHFVDNGKREETLEDCPKLSDEKEAKRRLCKLVIEYETEKLVERALEFVDDHFGDSIQNQLSMDHDKRGVETVGTTVTIDATANGVNGVKVNQKSSDEQKADEPHEETTFQDLEDGVKSNCKQNEIEEPLETICQASNESRDQSESDEFHVITEEEAAEPDEQTYPTNSVTCKEPGEQEQSNSTQQKLHVISEELAADESCIQDVEGSNSNETEINSEATCSTYRPSNRDEQAGNQVQATSEEETPEPDEQMYQFYVYADDQHEPHVISKEATESSNGESFQANQESNDETDEEEIADESMHGLIKVIESETEKLVGKATEFVEDRFGASTQNQHSVDNGKREETLEDCPKLCDEKEAKRRLCKLVIESETEKLVERALEFVDDQFGDSIQNQLSMGHDKRGVESIATTVTIDATANGVNGVKVNQESSDKQKADEPHEETTFQDLEDGVKSNRKQNEIEEPLETICQASNESRDQSESDEFRAITEEEAAEPDEQTYPTNSVTCKEPSEQEQSNSTQQKLHVISEELAADESCIQDFEGSNSNETEINSEATCSTYRPSHRDEQAGNQVQATSEEETPEPDEQIYQFYVYADDQHEPHVSSKEATESSNGESFQANQESNDETDEEEIADESMHGSIKYRSEGDWFSKMIVTFTLNGKQSKKNVSGDGKRVKIPADATDIEVRFKVSRPIWGFIMKYDRFEKTWCKPYEPHVFRYERPPIRTFTISGPLRWEAVMRVSDEYHEETKEMS